MEDEGVSQAWFLFATAASRQLPQPHTSPEIVLGSSSERVSPFFIDNFLGENLYLGYASW
jgi:hypothetical protein